MSQTWVEDLESEDYESNGEADYRDPGDVDARAQRIMRERQRMMLEQRRRAVERRPPAAPSRRPTPPGASRSVGREIQVELDSLRRELKESNRRASRGTWAAVLSAVAGEAVLQIEPLQKHPIWSAAVLGAPILLVSPEKHRSGVEGLLTDPRVIGVAAIVGIGVLRRFTEPSTRSTTEVVNSIKILNAPPTLQSVKSAGGGKPVTGTVAAVVEDKNGNSVQGAQISWSLPTSTQLTFKPNGSLCDYSLETDATTEELVTITASAPGATAGSASVIVLPV
jgi:hypothetical protein